jgi:hypothetical protein
LIRPTTIPQVQLISYDEVSVELRISGYQFPDRQAWGERDWDANWLQVRGNVTEADGKAWSFDDPSLTTWEAQELGTWLHDVAAGTVQPSPFGTDEPERLLVFTEPNLAFSLESRIADRVWVRVRFGLEALPPWLQGAQQPDYSVLLDLSAVELAGAASTWAVELADYPER